MGAVSLNVISMFKKTISPDHFTMYPNQAFLKIRQLIKYKKLNEIDISVYFLILDRYNLVASICKKEKKPIKNVSVSIKSIAEGLGRSKTYANERLKALHEVGMISRVKAEESVSGNKNTRPLIYIEDNKVVDTSDKYLTLDLPIEKTPINLADELKNTTITTDDDGVPF